MNFITKVIYFTSITVKSTKKNLSLLGLEGEVFEMDAQNMKFENDTIEFIYTNGCLIHMPEIDNAIKEIYRVLKSERSVCAWMY